MTVELLSVTDAGMRSEWLRRELGVTVTALPADELAARLRTADRPIGLLVTDPGAYLDILPTLPAGRVVMLLPNDQHYRADNRALAALPAVRAVFRPHSLDLVGSLDYARAVVAGLTDARPASTSPRQVAAALKGGRNLRRAVRAIRGAVGDRYGMAPIGYTTKFAQAFVAACGPMADDASLLEHALAAGRGADDARPISVSFRGARGQFQRRTGVHLAARVPGSDCASPIRRFSGLQESDGLDSKTYVVQLQRSRFALCPPGFQANESFRAHEALVCGALPVILDVVISQGTRAAGHLDAAVRGGSWSAALRQMQGLDEPTRRARVERAQRALLQDHRDLRRRLGELLATP